MLKPYINMSVSTISIILAVNLPNQCWNKPNHFKQVLFQVGKSPILEYFQLIL